MSTARQYSNFLRNNIFLLITGIFLFVSLMGIFELMGVFRSYIGYIMLFAGVALYAGIGWVCRTDDPDEYFVAGRRVPAIYNGMAVAADWMSAASFIGMAGTLYLSGFDGLAFVIGWTGGYVLVALLLAPYLRKYGGYTIPDFLGDRFGGNAVRVVAIVITFLVSFVYLIAQLYGVGLIAQRISGLDFVYGVFFGLAGVLLTSFLGGMRAITWTQVAQFIIMILAYAVPATILAYKHTSIPLAQFSYGIVLDKLADKELSLSIDENEIDARDAMKKLADSARKKLALMSLNESDSNVVYSVDRLLLEERLQQALTLKRSDEEIEKIQEELGAFPKNSSEYKKELQLLENIDKRAVPPQPHSTPFMKDGKAFDQNAKVNFMALVFCLMLGTAALPHILVRFMTTSSVKAARDSSFWSLFFILCLYLTAPALAVLVKYDIYTNLVGTRFADVSFWVEAWAKVDSSLIGLKDFNKDGVVQLAELVIGSDLIVLASAEIAGLPFFLTGLILMGGIAAALSTADGLLMAISGAVSHDLYTKTLKLNGTGKKKAQIAKGALLCVAALAALVTVAKPGSILFLVAASFSLAAAGLFPALVLGIFWKRTTALAALAGMLSGFGLTMYYMMRTYSFFIERGMPKMELWYGINPIGSGVFGVALGFVVIIVLSFVTPKPSIEEQKLVDKMRLPYKGD